MVDQPLVGGGGGAEKVEELAALAHPERVAGIVYAGTYASGGQMRENGVTAQSLVDGVATPWPLHALTGNAEALTRYEIAEGYSGVTAPALILHGDSDVVTPLDPRGA
ncbi:hypothetical protein ABZ370_11435 [Streptomyces sp. NPDC005962]|uniref:alpha/beta fold hydrolase n=1 Tax=Streptomyces sp. NPDC005962 TaxID=3154466 RepID=UPI0033C4C041